MVVVRTDGIRTNGQFDYFRGFNDAVNCFPDEGWVSIINDGPSTVSIHINPLSNGKQFGGIDAGSRIKNGIICAKASLLLQVGFFRTIIFSFSLSLSPSSLSLSLLFSPDCLCKIFYVKISGRSHRLFNKVLADSSRLWNTNNKVFRTVLARTPETEGN